MKKMYIKLEVLVCLLLVTIGSYGQDPKEKKVSQPTSDEIIIRPSVKTAEQLREDTSKISFEVLLGKTDLLPLEPVLVKFNFTNRTAETLEISEPNLVKDLRMKSRSNGRTEIVTKLFNYYISGPSATRVLNPGETIQELIIFEPSEGMFKTPGEYEAQFFLDYPNERIWSNPVNIVVNEPKGVDKEAYDFIRANSLSECVLFNSNRNNIAMTKSLHEEFINRFGTSRYYEYAVLCLSNLYSVTNEPGKAKNELLKLKNTENKLMNALIEKRLATLTDAPSKNHL